MTSDKILGTPRKVEDNEISFRDYTRMAEESGENLESQIASLTARLAILESKVSKMDTTHENTKKRLEEVQQFSENIINFQERKLMEIEENAKEQKKILGEIRIHLQILQNSRVNHKDVLVRHENQTKKLIELVNEISAKQHELEMDKEWIENAKAKRFSSFVGKERKIRDEELYDFKDGRHLGKRSEGRHHRHLHRRVQSVPVDKVNRERRKSSSSRRLTNQF